MGSQSDTSWAKRCEFPNWWYWATVGILVSQVCRGFSGRPSEYLSYCNVVESKTPAHDNDQERNPVISMMFSECESKKLSMLLAPPRKASAHWPSSPAVAIQGQHQYTPEASGNNLSSSWSRVYTANIVSRNLTQNGNASVHSQVCHVVQMDATTRPRVVVLF